MADYIREAGWGIWPVFLFGGGALALAVLYLVRPRSRYLALVVGSSVATVIAGFLGTLTGLQRSAQYISEVAADQRWIFLIGLKESLGCLVTAFVLTCVVTLIAMAGGYRQASRRPEADGEFLPGPARG